MVNYSELQVAGLHLQKYIYMSNIEELNDSDPNTSVRLILKMCLKNFKGREVTGHS